MVRRTRSAATALERMRAAIGLEGAGSERRAIRHLAFLADLAKRQRRDDVRQLVRWTGSVPTYVKGWEGEALAWLRVEA